MYAEELHELLELLATENRWCQNAEAKDVRGDPVKYSDPDAVAWDLTGALCLLFGWQRASVLFHQLDKHLLRFRSLHWRVQDEHIESMLALQEMNDSRSTSHEWLLTRIKSMPVVEGLPPACRPEAVSRGNATHSVV